MPPCQTKDGARTHLGVSNRLASGLRHGRRLDPGSGGPKMCRGGAYGIPLNYKRRTLPAEKEDDWEKGLNLRRELANLFHRI